MAQAVKGQKQDAAKNRKVLMKKVLVGFVAASALAVASLALMRRRSR